MALRVHVCTWNVMSTQPPDVDLRELLHLDNEEDIPDVVAVGLQEVDAKPQSLLIEYIKENSWVKLIQAYLGAYGLVKLRSIRMLGMVHLVSVHMRHLAHVREIRPAFCKTAFLGLLGTKGAVALRFCLYGKSFCFIDSHFAAHAEYTDHRNMESQTVSDYITFPNCTAQKTPQKILDHDYVFWLGDFNYRINESSENIKALCSGQEYTSLWQHDQLLQSQSKNLCFVGYKEGPLSFPPTYKYNPGTNDWDTESGKFRKPAWTDRVLWKENDIKSETVQLVTYKSHDQYMPSDHKPVSALLAIDLHESMTKIEDPIDWKIDLMSMPWYGNEDGLSVYVVKNYKTYSWDWIGLYRVGFHHLWDYEMYEWAVGDGDEYGENGCAVLFDCLPEEAGHYVMAYYSYKMEAIISVSEPFEILPPRDEDKDPVDVQVEQPQQEV
ncbi:phosphatidylinositol 4,5-bisphosphate 5-phosphatase A isoform X2 [Exaiptasia diaphana]|uniref:Inositol polyphosphate-related phosphatase domain-containing protein n=1 Tax=Exaiptasia diaphana TaxID=2652724 RepID=A0A913WXN6_EXADI|nr:phosphatidylinositol 4,5-bisphosphate 5-phosphatase A isoform X2 [Exaiptasia diaphana]KXJ17018.1 Phosphatidylinositol 4,5-bisphosphate 5-phosphatase A [Exaiptasia diaphana]